MNLIGSVLFGCEDIIVPYVQSRVPYIGPFYRLPEGRWTCTALGVVSNNNIIGGVIYHEHRPRDGDIMVSLAFDRPWWCRYETLYELFNYPFGQLGCDRITAVCARKNKKSRRIVEKLGFKLEGIARKAIERREDAFLYGLLKPECRFINGQVHTTAARAA